MSRYSHLSTPDPEFRALIPHPPDFSFTGDVKVLRERQRQFQAQNRESLAARLPAESAYRIEECKIAVESGEIALRCVIPTTGDAEKRFPVLVWFHGGGLVVGDLDMNDFFLRKLLAPEHVYPIPWDDAYAATKWVVRNTSFLSASLAKGFIVAGTSAGANLAAAVACRARDDPFFAETPVTGKVLQVPPLLHPEDPAAEKYSSELLSMEQNKDGPVMTRDGVFAMTRMAKVPLSDSHFSVLLQPSHAGVPPVYMQVAGMDPLRDEGLLYAKLLEQAGVATKVDVYPGVPHGFSNMFPQLTISVKANKDLNDGIRWLLGISDASV